MLDGYWASLFADIGLLSVPMVFDNGADYLFAGEVCTLVVLMHQSWLT